MMTNGQPTGQMETCMPMLHMLKQVQQKLTKKICQSSTVSWTEFEGFLYIYINPLYTNELFLRVWLIFVCLIWFFMSHQQSFSYVGTGLPRLNQ